jgi:macrolide transport system ATP-binding/permease protein
MTALLRLNDIKKHYMMGDTLVKALDGVSLEIHQGEFVAIMGQSGSGKSTLMNILGCLDRPSEGSYIIDGQDVSSLEKDELSDLRRNLFGFVFQRYNLLATATAAENVEIPAVYAGMPKSKRHERATELLTQLGLSDRIHNRPSQLSGGQQQRVAIARALMNNPAVILADEPTGALDSATGEEVMALLKDLHTQGRTVILITHDKNVARHADRVIRIQDGLIQDDPQTINLIEAPALTAAKKPVARYQNIFQEITESSKTALRALRVNLFRTSLTLLGIIIGVAAVITMLAVGNGSKQDVLNQISAMGTNLLSVRPGAPGIRGAGDVATMVPGDADAILQLPNITAVLPERNTRATARFGNRDYMTTIQGLGASLPQVREWSVAKGNFFSDQDLRSYAPVAVLGQTVVDRLFPSGVDPVGQFILIKNVPFEIIGIMSRKGATWGMDQDDAVFIPLTTGLIRIFGQNYISGITVLIDDLALLEQTQKAITDLLIERHRTEDFSIRNMASILDTVTTAQNALTILLGTVAAISLLVGGIGVMNIMLVSVTERTREIGIRMATGARMRDILIQFNTEAAVVCIVGGVIGIILGVSIGLALQAFGVSIVFSLAPSLLAFSCAFFTGVIFGYLPARQAARLDPVIALSSE